METLKDFMDKKAVAEVLDQIAAFLELKGENPFRIRAFRTAARAIGSFPGDLRAGLEDGSLAATKGVGPATLQIARSSRAPAGRACWRSCGSRSRRDWSRCSPSPDWAWPRFARSTTSSASTRCRSWRRPPGMAAWPSFRVSARRPSENILKGDRLPAPGRAPTACRITRPKRRKACAGRWSGSPVSSPRSSRATSAAATEVVRDVVIVLVADVAPAELFRRLNEVPGVHEFAGQDERRLTLRFAGGASAQIVVTTPVNAGAVLVQATGSEAHLRRAGRAGARPRS